MNIRITSKAVIVTLIGLLLLAGCAIYGFQYYQWHYLSTDLSRALTAAMDPAGNEKDVDGYLHDARLLVRTKRDATVLHKFETFFAEAKDANETKNRRFREVLQSLDDTVRGKDYEFYHQLDAIRSSYRQMHVAVPKTLQDQMTAELKEIPIRQKEKKESGDAEDRRADREQAHAQQLLKELRSDLGMPPLPTPKP
jgi:putative alpha-1,2-mannosidase